MFNIRRICVWDSDISSSDREEFENPQRMSNILFIAIASLYVSSIPTQGDNISTEKRATIQMNRAVLYLELGTLNAALKAVTAALSADPDNVRYGHTSTSIRFLGSIFHLLEGIAVMHMAHTLLHFLYHGRTP